MKALSDDKIIESWQQNAAPWTAAVRQQQIESRKLVTDRAIIDAILSVSPKTVLDIGCGEGWLVRELATRGITASGIDAVPELIAKAESAGGGSFRVMAYEDVSATTVDDRYDAAVCNFSLLGKGSVEHLFRTVPKILVNGGYFIVQTVHPKSRSVSPPYTDGWREGSWAGFGSAFNNPPPWYFRTLESWFDLYGNSGFAMQEFYEPFNPKTDDFASALFVGKLAG